VIGDAVTGDDVTGGCVTGAAVTGGPVAGVAVTGGAVAGADVTGVAVTGAAVTGADVTGAAVITMISPSRSRSVKLYALCSSRLSAFLWRRRTPLFPSEVPFMAVLFMAVALVTSDAC
jgi:hypothetical protein